MVDLDLSDIIEFIRHLKRGFDKDLFQNKLEDLANVAESTGIEKDDFHTLFKLWLNLSIPITKWVSLGSCLVPQDQIEERTVDYAFRWLLANCENHSNFSRMAFLLDWLTAAMDSDSVDLVALDSGYEIFYSLLSFELLTIHTLKIVYTLTKPNDVTRKRVLELLDLLKKREGKKNMYNQIQVLLGLFKSYKPQCVPEDVPAISIYTSFRKISPTLQARFKRNQERRNSTPKERHHLLWINPLNSAGGRNKKGDPLVPNLEFCSVRAAKGTEDGLAINLDFSDPVSLLHHAVYGGMRRPARLRALLCNQTGLALLGMAKVPEQQFFAHDLRHLLTNCFLDSSPHSSSEKADLLLRLASLQRVLLQGLPVVTRFLAQYLPFWNEKDYFAEILSLVEWLSSSDSAHVCVVVESLSRACVRAAPLQQCSIVTALTRMYCNMVYSSTRKQQYFSSGLTDTNNTLVLPMVANNIADLCEHLLQISPEDMRIVHCTLRSARSRARGLIRYNASATSVPRLLSLAVPLTLASPLALDAVADLLLLYRKIFSMMKSTNKHKEPSYIQHRKTLESYTSDFLSCLYHENALSGRNSGLVFTKIHPQLAEKLTDLVPSVDATFSLRNGLAFTAYTYMPLDIVNPSDASNKLCFDTVVSQNFPHLSEFLIRAVSELR